MDRATSKLSVWGVWGLVILPKTIMFEAGEMLYWKRKTSTSQPQNMGAV